MAMPQMERNNVFERLLKDRIVWLGSEVRDENANEICAKILLLAAEDSEKDIARHADAWIKANQASIEKITREKQAETIHAYVERETPKLLKLLNIQLTDLWNIRCMMHEWLVKKVQLLEIFSILFVHSCLNSN